VFRIKALIVDDHRLFAEAIRPALEQLGMDVALATTGHEALKIVTKSKVDIALVDLGLPDMRGIDVGARIVEMQPGAIVLALTAIDDQRFVAPVLQAGFSGYLTKGLRIAGLVSAITAALEGQLVTPGLSAGSSGASRTRTQQHIELLASTLTPREREVLAHLAQGESGQEIAREMSISVHTVRTHVQSILAKLQVHSRLEAAMFAVRHDLVPSAPEETDVRRRSNRRAV
jgi:two-component system, NarL family, nitrate/nitrite response regulator NarL